MVIKKCTALFLGWYFLAGSCLAQDQDGIKSSLGSLPVGIGATFVDGEMYYLLNVTPEVAFGHFGCGLDLNLRFSKNGKVRAEYKNFGEYLRIIRYVRWAQKGDPFYIRVGLLDYAQLGHGFILYNYKNTASYDLRKVGMELDVNFDKFGFESVISDFAHAGIVGIRGYIKPLKFTSLETIPVINNFEIGASVVSDWNDNANKTYSNPTNSGALSIFGFDLGLPLLSYRVMKSTLYIDYAKIIHYGSGSTLGIDFHFSGLGLLAVNAKYERRFIGAQFIPSYFNALYERERYAVLPPSLPGVFQFTSKAEQLRTTGSSHGYYGELLISVLNTVTILGGYQATLGIKNAGIFHAEFNVSDVIPSFVLSAGYDRKNIGQLLKLDENSLLYAEIGYKPIPFMVVSTVYQWTWTRNPVGVYKTQRRIEPKVSFVYNF
ncbi:MAG: hypothetical protein N3A63_05935 [Bacteroidetes bacterium]|nr:hypothetical protein [Bacteroidota bacterium]